MSSAHAVRLTNCFTCPFLWLQSHPRGLQRGRAALREPPGAGESVPVLQRWQLHLRAAAVVPPQPPGPAGRAGQAPGAGLQERAPLRRRARRPALLPRALQQLGPGLHHALRAAPRWGSLRVRGSEPAQRGETVPLQIHLRQRLEIKETDAPDTDTHIPRRPPWRTVAPTAANYREKLNLSLQEHTHCLTEEPRLKCCRL